MAGKAQKIKRKWVKFLENLRDGMTQAEAYQAAGYRCETQESAARAGSRLLIKLREIIDGVELFDIYVPNDELAKVGSELLHSKDPRVRATMFLNAAKVKRWVDRENEIPQGVTIVINRQFPDEIEGDKPIQVQAPVKPRQITD